MLLADWYPERPPQSPCMLIGALTPSHRVPPQVPPPQPPPPCTHMVPGMGVPRSPSPRRQPGPFAAARRQNQTFMRPHRAASAAHDRLLSAPPCACPPPHPHPRDGAEHWGWGADMGQDAWILPPAWPRQSTVPQFPLPVQTEVVEDKEQGWRRGLLVPPATHSPAPAPGSQVHSCTKADGARKMQKLSLTHPRGTSPIP